MTKKPQSGDLQKAILDLWMAGPKPDDSTPEKAISRARAGSADDAKQILRYAARCFRSENTTLLRPIAHYLADACEKVVTGVDIRLAFNLGGQRGPNKFKKEQRDAFIAHNAAFCKMLNPRDFLAKTADMLQQMGIDPPRKGGEWTAEAVSDAIEADQRRKI